jgi:HSP20 family molecular chaperone IbpA
MSYDLGFDLYGPGMGQYAPTMGQRTVGGEVMGRGADSYRSPDWGMTTATPYGGNRDWPVTDDLRLFRGGMMSGWQPKCIARATEGGMLVEASLPGVKREDINLQIVDGDLLLSGERKEEKSREGEGYLSRESSYGKFQRRMWLPEGAQLDQIKAGFDNGMLTVFIPLSGRQRMTSDMGQGRQMREEGRQTYTEWGGAQAQPDAARDVYSGTVQRQEERGPIQQEGTMEETKPLLEKKQEMKPLPERREEERKPLLEREREKGKERMDTVQQGGSGIFIGSEATTTDASNV